LKAVVNKISTAAVCLEIGTRTTDNFTAYPDIEMVFDPIAGSDVAHTTISVVGRTPTRIQAQRALVVEH
jgi:uncharacterized cupin superfamily protein